MEGTLTPSIADKCRIVKVDINLNPAYTLITYTGKLEKSGHKPNNKYMELKGINQFIWATICRKQ